MNEKEFQNKIRRWKNERLTAAEKQAMLQNILNRSIESPYTRYLKVFVYIKRPVVMALSLVLVFSGSVAYASQNSLPGEKLYAIKTRVVEPIVDAFNTMPAQKLAREEAKVETRLAEAKALAADNKLDEVRVKEIEEKIEQSSAKFVIVAEEISKKVATTTEKQAEKREELKRKFRERITQEDRKEQVEKAEASIQMMSATLPVEDSREVKDEESDNRDKIERLKNRALKVLEARNRKGLDERD